MNTAQSLFGISQLEAAKKVEKSIGYFDNSYIIELSNGELITIKELCDFWIEGHKKIDKTKEIIEDIEKITKKEIRCKQQPADEKEVEGKPGMEGFEANNKRKTKRGPDNKKTSNKKLQSSSPESK